MGLREFKNDTAEEIGIILGRDFNISVSDTSAVPHADTSGISFPNLDTRTQSCKIITTSVLYIDIRRSTQLNLEHKPQTVAKLYSAFVRAMTRCAAYHRGHVRGIIGDRVMVIFNPSTAFVDAVNTAILMNSVMKFQINKLFAHNEVSCGIGIDYGRMLATKTGIRKNGQERNNYRSLVWLGRPANVASKLTDVANKTTTTHRKMVHEGHYYGSLDKWGWYDFPIETFVDKLKPTSSPNILHPDEYFRHFFTIDNYSNQTTAPILMTKPVYDGLKKSDPEADHVKNGMWSIQTVPSKVYGGPVYGGDVHFNEFVS